MSYQKIIIVGNVGRDPEMRYTPSGQAVTSFSVAVDESYSKEGGEKVKRTTWFRVESWGKQAEICKQYLSKGSKVLVEGRMKADAQTGAPRTWSKQDGTTGTSFEVSAQTVKFLSGTREGHTVEAAQAETPVTPAEDEFPF